MPVVARSIPILSGFHFVRLTIRNLLLLTAAMIVVRPLIAQDGSTPTGTDSRDPAVQESSTPAIQPPSALPEITPAEKVPLTPVPEVAPPGVVPAPAFAAANQGCLQEILEQQKKTRALRDMRNKLPGPSKEDADKLKREYALLLTGGFGAADVKKIQDVLSFRILQATDPEFVLNPANMQELLQDIENDIARCGNDIGNAANKVKAKRAYCKEVLTVTKQLLDNNLDSRIAAVNIMRMLYEVSPPVNAGKATLLTESLAALLAVLADKEQPDSVKVAAANSVRNILRNCEVIPQDQFLICDVIGDELARPCCESAYQIVLLDALFGITKPRRTVGDPEPTALKVFAAVLNDRNRPIEVRCHAALGVGRAAYDPKINFDPLAHKIARLTLETGVLFTQAQNGDPKWVGCGADLFFAFRPLDKTETDKGLMNRAPKSEVVAAAAPLVIKTAPLILMNGQGIPLADLQAIKAWVDANQPTNLKWDANAPPLDKDP